MPQIDLKLVAAAALILGLFSGFYIDNTLLSKPKINSLTETVNQQESTISELEDDLQSFQSDYDTLEEEYTELSENNVPLTEYTTLQNENNALDTQINSLETEVNQLTDIVAEHTETIDDLKDELDELQDDYDKLLNKYEEAYNPLYVAYTVDNIEVNLTTAQDTFPENTAITGTVHIRYTNGTSFKGSFKLTIYKVYMNSGTSSEIYTINREKDYTWNSPFVLGAGSYKLSLSDIKDESGNLIVSNTALRSHVIYIFVG
ncbi:hypothetical protein DRQ11_10875 [candidate division KSB1 bacterium]|nr:MAG: hypothetical protein DRQ11_10875 [candidate division KSB1 bacterium]